MAATANAIFLSYSAQDEEAARRLSEALPAAGLDVWFDQNELRGGDAWDASIPSQIKECALFVPIISASTEARGEGYFRLEWRLAVERSYLMADDQAFLMPVVIARAEGRFLDAVKLWAGVPVFDALERDEMIGLLHWAAGRTHEAERKFHDLENGTQRRMQRDPRAPNVLPRLVMAQSMLGEHEAALASIDAERARVPESRDPVNGPALSFTRSVFLVRAGRAEEGYAEATRLLHVPFSTAVDMYEDRDPVLLLLKDDPRFDELINHPPRL